MAKCHQASENRKLKVLLNATENLQQELEEFKKGCDAHEKHRRKRCKRRYFQMGLAAKVVPETTFDELDRLVKNGVRTLFLDTVTNLPDQLQELLSLCQTAIEGYEQEEYFTQHAFSIAVEIQGDTLRLGRMRNNCSVLLQEEDIITLTTDESYRYTGFNEIMYVRNLKYYHEALKLDDAIIIGDNIRCKVIKKLKDNVAVLIQGAGLLNSYDYVEILNRCYLTKNMMTQIINEELEPLDKLHPRFIVVTRVRCKEFVRSLQSHLHELPERKALIGAIDYDFISSQMLDLVGIIKTLDYLWIPDFFTSHNMQKYIDEEVIPTAKCLKKPIIGSVPLERCSDFKRFENHDFLWKIDAMFIQKSSWCNKYPLIVKKLLPFRDFRMRAVQTCTPLKDAATRYQSAINFIIRTISSIECNAIIMYSLCDTAPMALSAVEIYCPVLVVLPLSHGKDDKLAKFNACMMYMAQDMNLRRNIRTVIYTPNMNPYKFKPLEFGVWYARKIGLLETGDFVVTVEICKQIEACTLYGEGGEGAEVATLCAYYLPPLRFCKRYRYG